MLGRVLHTIRHPEAAAQRPSVLATIKGGIRR